MRISDWSSDVCSSDLDQMNMTDREYLDQSHEDIIAHELFHHWFGDMVTCESWSNLPLNEAFATYGEYLWMEHKYGRTEADMHGFQDMIHYLHDPGEYGKHLISYQVPRSKEHTSELQSLMRI